MKKKLIFIFLIVLIFIIIYEFRYKFYYKLPFNYKVIVLSIFSNDKTVKKIKNDSKTRFLPETQLVDLNFKKIKIKEFAKEKHEVAHGMYTSLYPTFYIEKFENFVFLISKSGQVLYLDAKKLGDKKINFLKVESNLNLLDSRVLNFHISDENIYILITRMMNENCETLQIKKSKIDLKNLNFVSLIDFKECLPPGDISNIGITSFTSDNEKIIISTGDTEFLDKNKNSKITRAQDKNSIFGKTLLIDTQDKIFSMGHRVVLGLYSNEDGTVILGTENGPRGGDEINKIELNNNYGWDIASYGEKYNAIKNSLSLLKSHSENNFTEPLYSFMPSIAPTSLIKINNNFSPFWVDNFLMGSLVYEHLLRLKFSKNFDRLILIEPIYIGERIRDLIYLEDSRQILLSLESTGSLGVIVPKE